jgi:hypothetical protein
LFKSTDQGRNWVRISPDLTTNDRKKQEQDNSGGLSADNTSAENHTTIFAIAESPLDENIIWVGTDDGNLQYTTDGGKTWTNVSANIAATGMPAQTWVSSVEPSRFDKQVVYASFDNHMYGDHKTYFGKSSDMGKTWTLFKSDEFTGFAHKIKEDLINKDLLFAGTEMGLFASVTGGREWFRMKNRIPEYALVRDIAIHPKTHDLILGTHGRGVIVVDDIRPMRDLAGELSSKPVHIFTADAQPIRDGQFGNGGFPPTGGWSAGNPAGIPPIQYYLKDRIMSGDVKVEILNEKGELVQSMPGSKRKGVNKVYWNQRMTPNKSAAGGTKMDRGGMLAPQVLPGTYTLKLTVGKEEYKQPIVLVHDSSNTSYSIEDRLAQNKASMELYNMQKDLNGLIEEVNGEQKLLKESSTKIKSEKVRKLLNTYDKSLEEFRAGLLATKQTSIFADEEQLRERLTELYVTIAGNEARPSNLQLERLQALQGELSAAKAKHAALNKQYADKVRQAMAKEGVTTPALKNPSVK